jgi:hypothetical protein
MADGLGGETENLIDQENPISPIQRQSSVTQNRDSNVPSSRVGTCTCHEGCKWFPVLSSLIATYNDTAACCWRPLGVLKGTYLHSV